MKYTSMKHNGKKVSLDFNTYIDCDFDNCEMVFGGGKPPVLENCRFNNCRFVLEDRAENTVAYLAFLFNTPESGGKSLVEETLAKITGDG